MRKKIIDRPPNRDCVAEDIDLEQVATVLVTSESRECPVDCAFTNDEKSWIAGESGEQTLILEFDSPQNIQQIRLAIEELDVPRCQELAIAVSSDGGNSYRELLRQEYHFSPPGTPQQCETWTVEARQITHLRLWILPDRNNTPCPAKLRYLGLR